MSDLGTLLPLIGARTRAHTPLELPSSGPRGAPEADPPRRAAVVVLVFGHKGVPSFLLIKRSPRGSFPGQWALPGGRLDTAETAVQAGLRELREETGVEGAASEVLGVLDDVPTAGRTVITPLVVGVDRPLHLRRNPAEVHSLHPIPLSRLTEPDVPRWRKTRDGESLLQMPLRRDMVVHAPTGAILWQFAQIALRGVPQEVAGLAQPAFLETSVPRFR